MEAFGLLLHGFGVLLTFKTLAFMIIGSPPVNSTLLTSGWARR